MLASYLILNWFMASDKDLFQKRIHHWYIEVSIISSLRPCYFVAFFIASFQYRLWCHYWVSLYFEHTNLDEVRYGHPHYSFIVVLE